MGVVIRHVDGLLGCVYCMVVSQTIALWCLRIAAAWPWVSLHDGSHEFNLGFGALNRYLLNQGLYIHWDGWPGRMRRKECDKATARARGSTDKSGVLSNLMHLDLFKLPITQHRNDYMGFGYLDWSVAGVGDLPAWQCNNWNNQMRLPLAAWRISSFSHNLWTNWGKMYLYFRETLITPITL